MPVHLRPVGPLPAPVYWRRRAVVAGVLLLVVVLLSRCGGSGDGGTLAQVPPSPGSSGAVSPTAGPSSTGDASPTDSPGPTDSPSPGVDPASTPCPDAALSVRAVAARGSYPVDARPVLQLSVRNRSTSPCTRALGQGALELTVLSGGDRIWSSDDCAPGGPQGPVVLHPQELVVTTVTWPAHRSAPGCSATSPAIGPGTYRVVGRVGTLRSAGTAFVITG